MKPIGIFYATREGQTERIAEYVAAAFRSCGFVADVRNLANRADIDPDDFAAVVLAASVHAGKHEGEMVRFVKKHARDFDSLPNVFISVTLSEAGAERATANAEEHARFAADVQSVVKAFIKDTGWQPQHVKPVAGALLYSKYNFLIRFVMKRIAKKAGAGTNTSRDYEYTDWTALDRFVGEFCQELSELTLDRKAG